MDKNLSGDALKLVRYKILFLKRDLEVALPEREELVSDDIDGAAYTAWKVAEFLQDLSKGETRVPPKWVEQNYPPPVHTRDGKLIGLPEEDKKYLRVYFEVLARYPRTEVRYEEDQVRVLEQIRDNIAPTGEGRDENC